jgi:hypothetical protein
MMVTFPLVSFPYNSYRHLGLDLEASLVAAFEPPPSEFNSDDVPEHV